MTGGPCEPPDHENQTLQEIQRRLEEQERLNTLQEVQLRLREQERLNREAEARLNEIERLNREVEAKRKEDEEKRKEVERLNREVEARRKEDEKRKEVERLNREVEARRKEDEKKRKEVERLHREVEARRKEDEEKRKEVERLHREVEARRKEDEEKRKEVERLNREVEARRKEDKERRKQDEERRQKEDEGRRKRDEEEKVRHQREEKKRRKEEAEAKRRREEEETRRRKEEEEEARRKAVQEARMLATLKNLEEQANDARRRETEAIEARKREEQFRKDMQERQRQSDEERAAFQRQLEEQAIEAKRREEEVAEAKLREEWSRREAEEQRRQAEEERIEFEHRLEESEEKLSKGIRPVVWPTKEEVAAAKAKVQYDPERLHFAVCGSSGSGKSSLINSFRGLKKSDLGAADVGNVETTLEVTRYADPRTELPYPRFVWCDIPGAGTLKIPAWQYFNEQGLFIFDFIVLVYDLRFSQIDADILENCRRFKIPALIVRSKASQQILNSMDDDSCEYVEAQDMYVKLTRANLRSNLLGSGLWKPEDGEPPQCYIVSRECVYDYIHSVEEDRRERKTKAKIPKEEKKGGKLAHKYIDEVRLVHDLLQTAYERRYIPKPGKSFSSGVMSSVTMAASKLGISVPTNHF